MDREYDENPAATGTTVPARGEGTLVEQVGPKVSTARSDPVRAKAPLSFDMAEIPAVVDRTGAAAGVDGFDADWDDEEEAAEQARRANREAAKRARRVTGALALVAVLGVGFAVGVLYEKHGGRDSSAKLHALAASSNGRRAGSRGRVTGPGGGVVVGTVTSISGGTLYVSERSGSALVKVVTGPSSTVTVPSTASVSSIQPGDMVIVQGAEQADGSYMAGTITDRGSSGTEPAGTGPSGAG